MKRVVWLIEAILLLALSIPLAILPYRCSIKAGESLGLLLFYAWRSRRRVAIENLKRAILSKALTISDGVEKTIKDFFKNFGRSFAEVIKLYYGFGKRIIDSVEIEGTENLNGAQSRGRGILFVTGHCGNWELMAIATAVKLSGIAIVARRINNPYINRFIEDARQRYGNSLIYKQGALKGIMDRLKKGGSVGVLMDQAVLPNEGYVIDFLGRRAWTTKMPALIARKTGAAVLPAFIHRTDKGHKIKIYPEVKLSNINGEDSILEDTKIFSEHIERYIKEYPSEWLWIHRRWKRV
ncbi:MAG: lysophospholipid acyltransferase family protein [Thermodesulfovibrionales bacterium]|nr:lysophospholipid acyltransferase family protein [Thermodesulfovibrionales bacterium]